MKYKLYDYLSDAKCTKYYDDFNTKITWYRIISLEMISRVHFVYMAHISIGIHSESFTSTRVYLCLEKFSDTTYSSMR